MKRLIPCLLAALVAIAPGGCSDEPEIVAPDLPLQLPLPTSEDQLMANFVTVFEELDYSGYLEVMDPEFRIHLQQRTVDDFGLPRTYYDYDEDADITFNMFSGEAPHVQMPGITGIDIIALQGDGNWRDAEDPRFPGAMLRPYHVHFVIHEGRGDDRRDTNVRGMIGFIVRPEEVTFEGRRQTRYRLVGQIDDTESSFQKPSVDVTWGAVKSLYRTPVQDQR